MRNIMIKTLMNRKSIPIYEAVENNIVGYEARLRNGETLSPSGFMNILDISFNEEYYGSFNFSDVVS